MATNMAWVLLHTFPGAARSSVPSPEGGSMSVPLPPAATPTSAEPSHHIHMAPSGRDARCSSAAARRASSGVVRRIAMPMSRRMLTPEPSIHGGRVMCSRSSTGTPCTHARLRARARRRASQWWSGAVSGPFLLHSARRGPPFRCDAATQTSLAASSSRRVGLEPGRPRPGGGPFEC